METVISNDLVSIEKELLLISVEDKDVPETLTDNFIQHKIDVKNIGLIKWSKLQSLLSDCIENYESCHYILRIYNIVSNEEENISEILQKIKKISDLLKCSCDIINKKQGIFGVYFEFLFQKKSPPSSLEGEGFLKGGNSSKKSQKYDEIKIGVFGEESSGKSTTTSVLIYGEFDDGEGCARKKNFRFQHEIQSGKTLSISHLIMGVDKDNKFINMNYKDKEMNDLIKNCYRFINIYDSGGSEKAMKTTLSLISPDYIDYSLLFIDYKSGCTENTKKLYSINNSCHIPIISIITMVDLLVNEQISEEEKNKKIHTFINKCIDNLSVINPSIKKLLLTNYSDVNDYIAKLNNNCIENYLPFILVSNTSGLNIELLRYLLLKLPNSSQRTIPLLNNNSDNNGFNLIESPLNQFDVHEHFIVDGKTILGGIVSQGHIKKNEIYYFGPNKSGNFQKVKVETIHCKKQEVDQVYEGQYSSLSLIGKNYNPNEVSKGMCLIGENPIIVPKAVKKFKADVWWIGEKDNKYMKYKCEPVVIINHIRQTCKIINLTKNNNSSNNYNNSSNNIGNLMSADFDNNNNNNSSTDGKSFTSKTSSKISHSLEMEDNDFVRNKKKRIKTNNNDEDMFFLSRNEKIELMFEFKNSPEYINEGSTIIINDNTFKAFGIITKVIYSEKDNV